MQGPSATQTDRLVRRAGYAARATAAVLRSPYEGLERIRERVSERNERSGRPYPYEADGSWHERLHAELQLPWPCVAAVEFEALWAGLVDEMTAQEHLLGRGTFGGWDDGDPALALAAFCLARHLRPRAAVETGVARGVTTRFLLEGLERNGAGTLSSIDLPPLIDAHWQAEVGSAVPERSRERWTLYRGSSRRWLPRVLQRSGPIQLFVHDSMHTERNLGFELDLAWRHLAPGGALLADDVDYSRGFGAFTRAVPAALAVAAPHHDGQGLFGIIVKPSLSAPIERRRRAPSQGTMKSVVSTILRF